MARVDGRAGAFNAKWPANPTKSRLGLLLVVERLPPLPGFPWHSGTPNYSSFNRLAVVGDFIISEPKAPGHETYAFDVDLAAEIIGGRGAQHIIVRDRRATR